MNFRLTALPSLLKALGRTTVENMRCEFFRKKVQSRFPDVHFEWPINLVVDDFSALEIGAGGFIGPYSEIVVLHQSPCSQVAGGLSIGSGVRIGMGANIRAAGGAIRIGDRTQIGQHVSIIGSNHHVDAKTRTVDAHKWDEHKTGVVIGADCWIGAGVIILPGVVIGRGAVIGAGSIVTKSVGENQVWHGNPARPSSFSASTE